MNFRTDLALERCEFLGQKELDGIVSETVNSGSVKVTRIDVTNKNAALAVGKPEGRYITLEVEPFAKRARFIDESLFTLVDEIKGLIPQKGSVLVAGLGNTKITPDAFGPDCASMIFATRHITGEISEATGLSGLRSVTAISTGVLGETGVESAEMIRCAVQAVKPDFVITVDALASRSVKRLGATVQMCNTGIVPGSGVGNSRQEISRKTVGVPVISIGVPTVVDAATLIVDLGAAGDNERQIYERAGNMMVTPREVDLMTERASKMISLAINCALQPEISPEDILILTA